MRSTILDTSQLRPVQLRRWVRDLVGAHASQLSLVFESFAFKRGVPLDADMVYDVRVLPNPYYLRELRPLNGRDVEVANYLREQPEVMEMLDQIEAFLRRWLPNFEDDQRSYLTVAIGCTGGQHRSVFMAETLASASRAACPRCCAIASSTPPSEHDASGGRCELGRLAARWRLPEREAVRRIEIDAAQVEFAGTIARSVAACEAGDPAEVAGLAIRLDGEAVGWVLLKRGASAPDWVGAGDVVISGLRIDRRQQGRGTRRARAGRDRRLGGTPAGRRPARLVLRVDEGNVAGIRAYEKAGWREVGARRIGRVGVECTMAKALG